MTKKTLILYLFVISSCGVMKAQDWSKEDSIWLMNILDGKTELKINEDTKKAIENGQLIVPSWMKSDDGKLKYIEITRDFSDTEIPDSIRIRSIDPYSMPPAVYSMYILYMDRLEASDEIESFMLSKEDRKMLYAAIPEKYWNNLYHNESFGGASSDFNHILSMVFSPSYRQKVKNRKNTSVYKQYDPLNPKMKLTERERRELNKAVVDMKTTTPITPSFGAKRNGID